MRHATDTPDRDAVNEDNAAWLFDALCAIWQQQHDRVDERLRVIERAVDGLAHGSLDSDLRREAERCAHMLAGSIGMFGFVDAARAARGLEMGLADPQPADAPALSALALSIREGVRAQPATPTCADHTAGPGT